MLFVALFAATVLKYVHGNNLLLRYCTSTLVISTTIIITVIPTYLPTFAHCLQYLAALINPSQ